MSRGKKTFLALFDVVSPLTPEQVQTWRKPLRQELIARRLALSGDLLDDHRRRIDMHLRRTFAELVHETIAFCWPYKNEYDARHLLADLRRRGATTVLPAIVGPGKPLVFREWHPGGILVDGPLGIPFPQSGAEMQPDSVLLPMLGFDAAGYRLGYGAGYFDRTLAALARRPRVIGVAHELAFVQTIHPQPHDIPADYVVTERGVYAREGRGLRFRDDEALHCSSPPCYAADIAPDYFGEAPPKG